MYKRRALPQAFAIVLAWTLAFWACSRMLTPPDIAQEPDALAYSSERALSHVRHIAAEPHPVGSPAHAAVAGYLLEQIAALGYRAEIQETLASARFDLPQPFVKAARIKNILVRIDGNAHQGAVLIAGHYDSAENAPGAADDGAAVASMLEVLRILKQSAPPQNDLIFLFSDAEELGLLGSRAFVEQHPWAKDCRIALNFEARGNSGMLLMFETSEPNARLIGHYAEAAVQPVASSLMFSFYKKLLHNDTDFSVFRAAGIPGMNFAFIEGWTDYHTRLDNPERLDMRTLALQGQNMLHLARHFADADLSALRQKGNLGYFNLPFGKLFLFSLDDQFPLLATATLLLAFGLLVAVEAVHRRHRLMHYFPQMAIFLLQIGAIAGINFAFHALIMRVYANYRWLPEPYNAEFYFYAACCLTAASFMLLHAGLRRWLKLREYAAGVLCLWFAAAIYLALEFPGGVFFAVAPGALMAVAWTLGLFLNGMRATFLTGLCSAAIWIVVVPTLYLAHHALGFHADRLLMIIAASTLALVSPALDLLYAAFGRTLPSLFLAVSLILLIWADRLAGFSADRPQPDSIVYAWDSASNTARWLSYDAEPDDWTRQFLGAQPTISRAGIFEDFVPAVCLLVRKTEPVRLAEPDVRVAENRIDQEKHDLDIRIRSRRNAPLIRLKAANLNEAVRIYADNQLIYQKAASGPPLEFIEFHGLRSEEANFRLVLPAAERIKMLEIIEIRRDLEEIWQENWKPRPADTMPMRSGSSLPVDAVILRRFYLL
jgi:hypothetical protein